MPTVSAQDLARPGTSGTGRTPVLDAPRAMTLKDAAGWLDDHRASIDATVRDHGAVLVRGLPLRTARDLAQLHPYLISEPIAEPEPFAARSHHGGHVYTSSEWPPDQPMCMHHEASYALRPPRLMLIACLVAPVHGGHTGLADARDMLNRLPADLVERFEREGWTLNRCYSDVVGLPWQVAFGTTDRGKVDAYCTDNMIETAWSPDGTLRTRQRRPAVVRHPVTGERCWFNQVAFLNEWTLDEAVREYLTFELGEDGLPFNTAHGDGSAIRPGTVATINAAYESATRREPWRSGDLLVIDNIRTAHSREPYSGAREMAVAMGDPVDIIDSDR